jgi:hypothetical protein
MYNEGTEPESEVRHVLMSWIQLRENRERVFDALSAGHVNEVVMCQATAFDELAAAMHAFGYWDQLEAIEAELDKDEDDVPNKLLLRELAVLPLLRIPNPHQAPVYLFQDHGVLRFLGFTLAQIRDGFNDKGVRSARGMPRMRPHHRDTLYNLLKAVNVESLSAFREAHMESLIEHSLLTSGLFLIDGTGLRGSDRHLVIMQQGGSAPPFVVNWRVQGPGKELEAGRAMVEELQQKIGAEAIRWMLMDGAYVDGTWLAHLQQQGIGAMVRVYEEMQIFQEMRLLSRLPEHGFETYRYLRTIQGHKEHHEVELAFFWNLGMWASYEQAWKKRGSPEEEKPGLWGVLIREERQKKDGQTEEIEWALVATKPLASAADGFQRWRGRWDVENQGFRELNQGGWLETQTWGRSESAVLTSIALKIGAHNCYCLMRTSLGQQLAVSGLRNLQHHLYGTPAQVLIIVGHEYALLTVEELVTLLGLHVTDLLDPTLGGRS